MQNIVRYYTFFLYPSYFLINKRNIHIENEKIQNWSTLSTLWIRVRLGVLKKTKYPVGREYSLFRVEYFYRLAFLRLNASLNRYGGKTNFFNGRSTPRGRNFFSLRTCIMINKYSKIQPTMIFIRVRSLFDWTNCTISWGKN